MLDKNEDGYNSNLAVQMKYDYNWIELIIIEEIIETFLL